MIDGEVIPLEESIYLYIDPNLPKIFIIDDFGAEIIDLFFKKKINKENVVKILMAKYNLGFKEIITNLDKFLENISRSSTVNKPLSYKTETLYLEIINKCNLYCKHCISKSTLSKNASLSYTEITRIIKEFSRSGGENLIIGGGEPFLREDLLEIISFSGHVRLNVKILTNGTLLTSMDRRKLEDLSKESISIQISLDGATENTNDKIRGKGSFKKVLSGIRRLLDLNYNGEISLCFTLTKRNIIEICDFIDLALAFSIPTLIFSYAIIAVGL